MCAHCESLERAIRAEILNCGSLSTNHLTSQRFAEARLAKEKIHAYNNVLTLIAMIDTRG